jgi:hypothetical protein
MNTRRTPLALALLALAGVLLVVVACTSQSAAPYTSLPAGVDATLRGTVDQIYVDVAATQIWLEAGITAQVQQAEQQRIADQIVVARTQAAGRVTAQAAAQETQQAGARQTEAALQHAAETATRAAELMQTADAYASQTVVAASSATAVMSSTREALIWRQTVDAATAIASSTGQAARATAVAVNHHIERENNTALMWTILTWVGGLGGVVTAVLLAKLGYQAFSTWDRRQHFVDQGNGESVMWDEIWEQLPDGRRVRRHVVINPSRAVGPVVDVAVPSPLPPSGDQARVAGQAQFTRGWIESARASARAIEAWARAAGAPRQLRAPAPVAASPGAQIPAGAQSVFQPPMHDESERLTSVVVIDGPADAQAAIPPRLLSAIERDWNTAEGGHDGDD